MKKSNFIGLVLAIGLVGIVEVAKADPAADIVSWFSTHQPTKIDENGDLWFMGRDSIGQACNLSVHLSQTDQAINLLASLNKESYAGVGSHVSGWLYAKRDEKAGEFQTYSIPGTASKKDGTPINYLQRSENLESNITSFGFSFVSPDKDAVKDSILRDEFAFEINTRLEFKLSNSGDLRQVNVFDLQAADSKKPVLSCFFR
jgi:hypothetical protein